MNDLWTQQDELDTLRAAYDGLLLLTAAYPCDDYDIALAVALAEYEQAEKLMVDMEVMR